MSVEVIAPGDYYPDELDSRMLQAAEMLLKGMMVVEVARHLGTTDRTIRRWKGDSRFREYLSTLQNEMLDAARNTLRNEARAAAETVAELRKDASGKGDPTRLVAALAILDRTGVEVQAQQAEGVRRILTRVPRELPTQTPAPAQVVEESVTVIAEDRPAVRIVTRRQAD